jgi:hypothetical protein
MRAAGLLPGKYFTFALLVGLSIGSLSTRPAWADELIYKSTGPKGEVTYAWRPAANAIRVEKVDVQTLSAEQRRAMMHLRQQEADKSVQATLNTLEDRWKDVDREIRDAQAALERAEVALQNGRTPRSGERLGIVGGGSRLTQAYFDRIHNLELGVEQANRRVDKAYDARNELR